MSDLSRPSPLPPALLDRAVRTLRAGGVVGFPTETVWGLAADPASGGAVGRLYAVKGREAAKPVQLSCLDAGVALSWARAGQEGLEALSVFWPGPLTVLAWAREGVPEWVAPGGVVGLRVPAHPAVRALLEGMGGALATTSLNPSGLPSARTLPEAERYGLADVLLPDGPGGAVVSGEASTVFDLRTRTVVRVGAVSLAEVLAVLP
ncbi:L-threonylcarbamoyladenylate synthase [Deinococcus aquiradiocola]|uniref:L-threonylcarbamoyladenylate synthase n=1 Tax=Deinococcus aquiradiocola TaxID=393059 RepID=A0A917PSI9_9DEIO|nr:L-threonylcarbamoyladenylate synthase [Deinococcus aquiradiocola]GGJ90191.1 SUA5-like protein [Deinococcus aquiradiocola]